MAPWRKCVLPGCQARQGGTICLFAFPKNEQTRNQWMEFVKRHGGSDVKITTSTAYLCSQHFTTDSFTNWQRRQLGFTGNPLMLVSGAEPTIGGGPPSPTPLPPPLSTVADRPVASQALPSTRERQSQCDRVMTREIGIQTDLYVGRRTVATQLARRTLINSKSEGSQAKVATKTVGVGTVFQLPPGTSPLKRKAVMPAESPLAKRPLLEVLSSQSSEVPSLGSEEDPTYHPSTSKGDDDISERVPTQPQHTVKYLVYEDCLLELFRICPTCSSVCKVRTFVKGTFLSVTQTCSHERCEFRRKWNSQPLLRSTPAGNLQLSAAVYFTGSSFIQTNKVLNAMNVRTFSRMAHRNHVHQYIQASVLHKWRLHQAGLIEGLKRNQRVSLGGDMRADSPGHCAKYGSYSVMDLNTNKIVDVQLVQSNEVKSSVHMEIEGLIRSLKYFSKAGVKVDSLVTDRHLQVQKYMREEKPTITHYYDVWHLCKAISKKLDAMAKLKECDKVKRWKKSIKNHLYWSASGSSSGEETVARWTSVINHVTNVHVHDNPHFPKCLHPPSSDKNKWLKPGSRPLLKLETALMNKRLLGDVKKLSPLYQTSALESYHSVILRFAPKSVVFSYIGMLCRLYLAALHFNENAGRLQAVTASGVPQHKIKFPKAKKGEHVVNVVKTNYTTEYVTELTDLLFNEVFPNPAYYVAELEEVPVPGFLCSQYEHPEKTAAVAAHVSRFIRPEPTADGDPTPI